MSLTFVDILTIFLSFWSLSYTSINGLQSDTNNSSTTTKTKLYFSPDGNQNVDLVIESTSRPFHQIVSNILLEILTKELKYSNVKVKINDERKGIPSILDSFSCKFDKCYPEAMINMEVREPRGFRLDDKQKAFITNAGPLGPVVYPGFFIPDGVVERFWNNFNATIDNWRFFKHERYASRFRPIKSKNYSTTMCLSSTECAQVLILDSEKQFLEAVIGYINATRLRMTPLLIRSFANLEGLMKLSPDGSKLPIVFSWYPSPLTLKHKLTRVILPCDGASASFSICDQLRSKQLYKWVWRNVTKYAPYAYAVIKNISFSQKQYEDILKKASKLSKNDDSKTLRIRYMQIAREWLSENEKVWKKWVPKVSTKTNVTIACIFPSKGFRKVIDIAAIIDVILDNINKNTLKSCPFNITLEKYDVSTDHSGSILYAYNQINYNCVNSRRLIGIMALTHSDMTFPVIKLNNNYKIPIISPTIVTMSRRNANNHSPYFYSIRHDHSEYVAFLKTVFKKFKWTRLVLFHQDELLVSERFLSPLKVVKDFKLDENKMTMKIVKDALKSAISSRGRIYLVDYMQNATGLILCAASQLNMTPRNGYVWILGSWLVGMLNDYSVYMRQLLETHGCTGENVTKIIDSGFIITPNIHDVADMKMRWQLGKIFGTSTTFDARYGHIVKYTFDALLTYAYALKALIGDGVGGIDRYIEGENQRKKFLNILSLTDFAGATGRITFSKDHWRPTEHWTFYQYFLPATEQPGIMMPCVQWKRANTTNSTNLWSFEYTRLLMLGNYPGNKLPSDGSVDDCDWPYFLVVYNKSCDFSRNLSIGLIVGCTIILFLMIMFTCFCGIRWYFKRINSRYPQPFAELQDALTDYEIPRSALLLQYPLGQGAFGTVYYGEMKTGGTWTGIAAKVLREGASSQERREFLCEAIKMRDFKHQNVMTIIGVVTTEPHFVNVMEFMLLGDLRKYLLTRHHVAKSDPDAVDIHPATLTSMALDIARGLEYLQLNKLVHRDLACRNCLVDKGYHVKISDFGMTRKVDDRKSYYRFEHPGILPVRWMAPESIQSGLFNIQTDIWSYGVVLYEIVTFGNQPYRGRTNEEVIDSLKRSSDSLDSYLVNPLERIPELFELMRLCWSYRPEDRPCISYLIEQLEVNPECVRPCLDESPPDPGETHPRGQGLDRCSSVFSGDVPSRGGGRGLGGVCAGAGVATSTGFSRMMSSGSRTSCDRTRYASGNRVETDMRHCDSVGRMNNLTSNNFTNSIASRLGLFRDTTHNSRFYAGGSSNSSKPYRHTCSQEFLSYSRHHSGDQEISTVSDPHGYQVEYDPLMINTVRSIAVNAATNPGYSDIPNHTSRDVERGSSSGGQRDDDDLDTDQQTLLNTGRA